MNFTRICRESSSLAKTGKKTGILHEDPSAFIMSPYIPLEMSKVSYNSSTEYQNTLPAKHSLRIVPLTRKLRKIWHIQSGNE
jgi:hypothetical protein